MATIIRSRCLVARAGTSAAGALGLSSTALMLGGARRRLWPVRLDRRPASCYRRGSGGASAVRHPRQRHRTSAARSCIRTPDGRTVNITRRADRCRDDFIALSSTCPHLGCQVQWEAQNNRYFCPCHNGTFDPAGKATGGPPGDAGLSLPRYALTVQGGLLYIDVPAEQLSMPSQAGVVHVVTPQGPGHDPA